MTEETPNPSLPVSDDLHAQIVVVPHHGAANPTGSSRPERRAVWNALEQGTAPLLDRINPEMAIIEFGNPRPVLGYWGRTTVNIYETTRHYYRERFGEEQVLGTDTDLAIMIYSDGATYTIETQAQRNRARGGVEDAVSDLSIGL